MWFIVNIYNTQNLFVFNLVMKFEQFFEYQTWKELLKKGKDWESGRCCQDFPLLPVHLEGDPDRSLRHKRYRGYKRSMRFRVCKAILDS